MSAIYMISLVQPFSNTAFAFVLLVIMNWGNALIVFCRRCAHSIEIHGRSIAGRFNYLILLPCQSVQNFKEFLFNVFIHWVGARFACQLPMLHSLYPPSPSQYLLSNHAEHDPTADSQYGARNEYEGCYKCSKDNAPGRGNESTQW